MKITPYVVVSAAILGTAGALVASGSASSSASSAMLIRTKQISVAATRRSNAALNYLAPIRTTTTDSANTGAQGVTPLSKVPGSGQGWTTNQIADGAITNAKMANPVYQAVVAGTGTLARGSIGVTATLVTNPGVYKVTFPVSVAACTYQATVGNASPGAITPGIASVSPDTSANAIDVETYAFSPVSTGQGTPNDRASLLGPANAGFHLTVTC